MCERLSAIWNENHPQTMYEEKCVKSMEDNDEESQDKRGKEMVTEINSGMVTIPKTAEGKQSYIIMLCLRYHIIDRQGVLGNNVLGSYNCLYDFIRCIEQS